LSWDERTKLVRAPSLNVVIISFRDAAKPGVRRAIRRDVEIEGSQHDALALEDLISRKGAVGQQNKLFDAARKVSDSMNERHGTDLGAMISSYLAARKMAVMPTSWSLTSETTRWDKNRSMMLTAIQRVSGSM
jgi:hypothetical protein